MRSPHAPAPSVRKPEARSSSPGRLALYCALVGAPFFAVAVLLQARGPIGLTAGIVAGVLLLLAVFRDSSSSGGESGSRVSLMTCRLCRPLAGDHRQRAEPKPGSSGRIPCKLGGFPGAPQTEAAA
jgi:hypothetical protein